MTYSLSDVKKIFKASGLTQKDFAEDLGVRPETARRWLNGTSVPKRAANQQALELAYARYINEAAEEAEDEEEVSEYIDLMPKQYKQLRKKLGLGGAEMGKLIGLKGNSQYYKYENGLQTPRKHTVRAKITSLWMEAFPVDGQGIAETPSPGAPAGGARSKLSTQKIMERASRFYTTHQVDLNRQLIKTVVEAVASDHNMKPKEFQEAVALFLALLKERISMDELFNLLMGTTP